MERRNAIRRIIIFSILSVLSIGIIVAIFVFQPSVERMLKGLGCDLHPAAPTISGNTDLDAYSKPGGMESQETAAKASGMDPSSLVIIAVGAAVILFLFFLLKIPQAIKALRSPEAENHISTDSPKESFAIPSLRPDPSDEITATAASPDSNTTTAPGDDDVFPEAGSNFRVEKSISLSEGSSLIDWRGEW